MKLFPLKKTWDMPSEAGKVVVKIFWLTSIIVSILLTLLLNLLF